MLTKLQRCSDVNGEYLNVVSTPPDVCRVKPSSCIPEYRCVPMRLRYCEAPQCQIVPRRYQYCGTCRQVPVDCRDQCHDSHFRRHCCCCFLVSRSNPLSEVALILIKKILITTVRVRDIGMWNQCVQMHIPRTHIQHSSFIVHQNCMRLNVILMHIKWWVLYLRNCTCVCLLTLRLRLISKHKMVKQVKSIELPYTT